MVFYFTLAAYTLLTAMAILITIGVIKNPPIKEIKRLLNDHEWR